MAVTTLQIPVRARTARRPRTPGYASQLVFVASGLIPILALFAVFAFAPVGIVLWLSLHKYNQLAPTAPFIGLRNFEYAFSTDPYFLNAMVVIAILADDRIQSPQHPSTPAPYDRTPMSGIDACWRECVNAGAGHGYDVVSMPAAGESVRSRRLPATTAAARRRERTSAKEGHPCEDTSESGDGIFSRGRRV